MPLVLWMFFQGQPGKESDRSVWLEHWYGPGRRRITFWSWWSEGTHRVGQVYFICMKSQYFSAHLVLHRGLKRTKSFCNDCLETLNFEQSFVESIIGNEVHQPRPPIPLNQGSPKCGPRPACGPVSLFLRPTQFKILAGNSCKFGHIPVGKVTFYLSCFPTIIFKLDQEWFC